jgi:hypothetical protein
LLFFLILVGFLGVEVKGLRRWIDIFFMLRFEKIEFLKGFLIMIFG